jgi:alpha-amylase
MTTKFKALWSGLSLGIAASTFMAAALPAQAAPFNPSNTSVQLFHWKWNDIAKECGNWLGPQGYGAVQVSPPTAAANRGAWWDLYQPVNHQSFTSKMGDLAQFQGMILACHKAGVRVYVDVVANHMAAGSGTATDGSTYDAATLSYPGLLNFSAASFHPACDIAGSDYGTPGNGHNVQYCRLVGLPDLALENRAVQARISLYLNRLVMMGVDGFRFDAAKHIPATDIAALLRATFKTNWYGEPLWVTQEVIPDGNAVRSDYFVNGTLNEFKFSYAMKAVLRNEYGANLAQLPAIMGLPGNWGGTWGFVPSDKATVFVNNWDTERNGGSLNASNRTGAANDTWDSRRYQLGNILLLTLPYGHAQVHSGFNFTNTDQDAPGQSAFDANGKPVADGSWDFIHRWPSVSNLVKFRSLANGTGIDNFTSGNGNQIAFNRGNKGFVAINNDRGDWNARLVTQLPAGTYCNLAHGGLNAAKTACEADQVQVDDNGAVNLAIVGNGAGLVPAVVLAANQKLPATAPVCASVAVTFRVARAATAFGESVYVNGNRAELGNWSATSVNQLNIETPDANSAWSRTLQLPPATIVQFKFAKHGGANDVWESNQATGSGNREAISGGCGQPAVTVDVGNFKF